MEAERMWETDTLHDVRTQMGHPQRRGACAWQSCSKLHVVPPHSFARCGVSRGSALGAGPSEPRVCARESDVCLQSGGGLAEGMGKRFLCSTACALQKSLLFPPFSVGMLILMLPHGETTRIDLDAC